MAIDFEGWLERELARSFAAVAADLPPASPLYRSLPAYGRTGTAPGLQRRTAASLGTRLALGAVLGAGILLGGATLKVAETGSLSPFQWERPSPSTPAPCGPAQLGGGCVVTPAANGSPGAAGGGHPTAAAPQGTRTQQATSSTSEAVTTAAGSTSTQSSGTSGGAATSGGTSSASASTTSSSATTSSAASSSATDTHGNPHGTPPGQLRTPRAAAHDAATPAP